MDSSVALDTLPLWVLVVGGLFAVAQLAFEIWALVDMLRRPESELTLGGRKWLWAIIILLVNWIGAILYFAVGRTTSPAVDVAPATPAGERADVALDALYGKPEDGGRA